MLVDEHRPTRNGLYPHQSFKGRRLLMPRRTLGTLLAESVALTAIVGLGLSVLALVGGLAWVLFELLAGLARRLGW